MTVPSVVPRTPVTIAPFPKIGEIETALVAWGAGSPARASDAWLPVIGCSPLLGVVVAMTRISGGQTGQGRAGGEDGAFGVGVDLLSGQEPGDRDPGVVRSAPGGGQGSRNLACWNRRAPARHDAVILSDLILDLDVQAGMGAAAA